MAADNNQEQQQQKKQSSQDTRKVDSLAGPSSYADMLRQRRLAIEAGDLEKAQQIAAAWMNKNTAQQSSQK